MAWRKLGHVFVADGLSESLQTHASNPVALVLDDKRFRVYYSARDLQQRSSIGYVDCVIEREKCSVLEAPASAVLMPGDLGTFDDSGVSMGCILPVGGQYYLYYLGWNLSVTVPWRNSIGLAVSDDGINFERISLAPVLDRNRHDPYTLSYPWVLKQGERWQMWYGSNLQWSHDKEQMSHVIKSASSINGIDWVPQGGVALHLIDDKEVGLSKPCVRFEQGVYRMWYAKRKTQYRIGYAESEDGMVFKRMDQLAAIDVSGQGWDCESVTYPCVFEIAGQKYMLYNGNGYGKSGFGIAKWQ